MENTERYQIILSAEVEAEEVRVNLDPEDLSQLEQALNQQLASTDEVGEAAGEKLAQGLEEGAARSLDLKAVLSKLKAVLAEEVEELAQEELAALKGALEHLARTQLSETVQSRTQSALLGLTKLAEAAEKGHTVKVAFAKPTFSPEEIERQAKEYARLFQTTAQRYMKRADLPQGLDVWGGEYLASLVRNSLQTKSPNLKALQTLREQLEKGGVEAARIIADMAFLYANTLPASKARPLQQRILQRSGTDLNLVELYDDSFKNQQTKILVQESLKARKRLEDAVGLPSAKERKLIGRFFEHLSSPSKVWEITAPGDYYEEMVRSIQNAKESKGDGTPITYFHEHTAAEAAMRIGLVEELRRKAARIHAVESQKPKNKQDKERIEALVAKAREEFNELAKKFFEVEDAYALFKKQFADKSFAKTERLSLGEAVQFYDKLPELKLKDDVLVASSYVMLLGDKVARGLKEGYFSIMRGNTVGRTPITKAGQIGVPVAIKDYRSEDGKKLKAVFGDGTVGRLKPEALGLPPDFKGVVQIRLGLETDEALMGLGKGTVLVDPRAENELNLWDLYTEKPEELLKAHEEGKLRITYGVVREAQVSAAKIGKQALLRHLNGGLPLAVAHINAQKYAETSQLLKEAKLSSLIAQGKMRIHSLATLGPLISNAHELTGEEGASTMVVSHEAFKGLDDKLYKLLDTGITLGKENEIMVPVAVGEELAKQLNIKPGAIVAATRNPMMGHLGGVIKAQVVKVLRGFRGLVMNERGVQTLGADFDGDTINLFRSTEGLKAYPVETVSTLMAAAGLLGGRKADGSVDRGRLVFEPYLPILESDKFKSAVNRLVRSNPEAFWTSYVDPENPLKTLYDLYQAAQDSRKAGDTEQYESIQEGIRRYKGLLRRWLKDAGPPELLEKFFLAANIPGADPRKLYDKIPIPEFVANKILPVLEKEFPLGTERREYDPNNPLSHAAGELTASVLGKTERNAQLIETVFNLQKLNESIVRASQNDPEAEKEVIAALRSPLFRAHALMNLMYQIGVDRQKRLIGLKKGDKTYWNLTPLMFTDPVGYLGEIQNEAALEEEVKTYTAQKLFPASKKLFKELGIYSPKKKITPVKVRSIRGLLYGEGDGKTPLDEALGFTPEQLQDRKFLVDVEDPNLLELADLLYSGIYRKESLIGSSLPHAEVVENALKLARKLELVRAKMDAGQVKGYEHSPEMRQRLMSLLMPALVSAEHLTKASVGQALAHQITDRAFFSHKAGREFLQSITSDPEELRSVLDEFILYAASIPARVEKPHDALKEAFIKALKNKVVLGAAMVDEKQLEELLSRVRFNDPKYYMRTLLDRVAPYGTFQVYADLQPSSEELDIDLLNKHPYLKSITEKLKDVSSHDYWANSDIRALATDMKNYLKDLPESERVALGRTIGHMVRSADVMLEAVPYEVIPELLKARTLEDSKYGHMSLEDYLRLRYSRGTKQPLMATASLQRTKRGWVNPAWMPSGVGFVPPLGFQADAVGRRGYVEWLLPEDAELHDKLTLTDSSGRKIALSAQLAGRGRLEGGSFAEDPNGPLLRYKVQLEGVNWKDKPDLVLKEQQRLLAPLVKKLPSSRSFEKVMQEVFAASATTIQQLGQEVEALADMRELAVETVVEQAQKLVETIKEALPETVESEPLEKLLEEAKAPKRQLKEISGKGSFPKAPFITVRSGNLKEMVERAKELTAAVEEEMKAIEETAVETERIRKTQPLTPEAQVAKFKSLYNAIRNDARKGVSSTTYKLLSELAQEVEKAEGPIKEEWTRRVNVLQERLEELKKKQVRTRPDGGGKPPRKPPADASSSAPPGGDGDDDDEERKRRQQRRLERIRQLAGLRYRPTIDPISPEEAENLHLTRKDGSLDLGSYKGLVRSRAEEEFLKAIYYNSRLGESNVPFDEFALQHPELLNAFFGPIRSFAGRETFVSPKNIKRLSSLLESMYDAFTKNDYEAMTSLVEDLNIQAKGMEVAAKQLADLREFKRSGTLPYTRNLHTGSKDALFYKRMLNLGGKELDQAIEEGDLETVQRIADKARHVEERIKLVQNAISNSMAFMFSSIAMNFFGQLQAHFQEMQQQARATAALANMSGYENIGKQIAKTAEALRIGTLEMTKVLQELDKEGLDPMKAAQSMEQLKGVLQATGESAGELAALYTQLSQMGGLDPAKAVQSAVSRGIYLSQASKLLDQANLRRSDLRNEQELGRLLLAMEAYQAHGIPIVLPERPEARRRRLQELLKEGSAREAQLRAEGRLPTKTSLEPSLFDRLAQQVRSTMEAVIKAAEPLLATFGSLLMLVLKVVEGVANLLSTPFGRVLVVASGLYATLLAIVQLQKTFQVGAWVRSLLQGLRELNGEMLAYLRNLKAALTAENLGNVASSIVGVAASLADRLKGVFGKAFSSGIGQSLISELSQVMGYLMGRFGGLLGNLFKPKPVGIVANPNLPKFSPSLPGILMAAGGLFYQMHAPEGMGIGGHLASTLGQLLLLSPLGKTPLGLAAGAALTFGVPYVLKRIEEERNKTQADKELQRVLKLAGGPDKLAEAVNGNLTPALQEAGYTAESLQKVLEAAAAHGSAKFRKLAEDVQLSAKAMKEAEERFAKASDFIRERYELYTAYLKQFAPNVYLPMDRQQAERMGQIFPGLLREVKPQELLLNDLKLFVRYWSNQITGYLSGEAFYAFPDRTAARQQALTLGRMPGEYTAYEKEYARTAEARREEITRRRLFETMADYRSLYGDNSLSFSNLMMRLVGQSSWGRALFTGAGALAGAMLGIFGGPAAGVVGVGLGATAGNQAYEYLRNKLKLEQSVYALNRRPNYLEVASLAGYYALSDLKGNLQEELKTYKIKEIPDTVALSRLTGEKRIQAVGAVRKAQEELLQLQQSALESYQRSLMFKNLGIDVSYGEGTQRVSGLPDVYRARSKIPELEARLEAVRERARMLQGMYADYLDIRQGPDGSFFVSMKEKSALAETALQNVTNALREMNLEVVRTRDELAQVRFDELLRNMVAKGEQAFIGGLMKVGDAWMALLGFNMPEDPFTAFVRKASELERQITNPTSASPSAKEVDIRDAAEYAAKALLGGGKVTALPGDKGPMWKLKDGHDGLDIAAPKGTPIRWNLPYMAQVVESGYHKAYGNYVRLYLPEEQVYLRFAHLDRPAQVQLGQMLQPGQVIGFVGSTGNSTGPHLHIGAEDSRGRAYRDHAVYARLLSGASANKAMQEAALVSTEALSAYLENNPNLKGTWDKHLGKVLTEKFRREVLNRGGSLETVIKEIEQAVEGLLKDKEVQKAAEEMAKLLGTSKEAVLESVRMYAYQVTGRNALRVQLDEAMKNAAQSGREAALSKEEQEAILLMNKPNPEASLFGVRTLEAVVRRNLALSTVDARTQQALKELEHSRKRNLMSDKEYAKRRDEVLKNAEKEKAKIESEFSEAFSQALWEDFQKHVDRELMAVRNERDRIAQKLQRVKTFKQANPNLNPKVMAAVNELIKDLEAQLALLPDFSKLREAEVLDAISRLVSGRERSTMSLDVMKLAESIFNDSQLTEEQKRRFGVNTKAKGLEDLLIPGSFLDAAKNLTVSADHYANRRNKLLQPYLEKVAVAQLNGAGALLEAPEKILQGLEATAQEFRQGILQRKRQELETISKQLGVGVEEVADLFTQKIFGQAIQSARDMVLASKRSALLLSQLATGLEGALGISSTRYRELALNMEAQLESLKGQKAAGMTTEEQQAMEQAAQKQLELLRQYAPTMDAMLTEFARSSRSLKLAGVDGNLYLWNVLNTVEKLLEKSNLPKELRDEVLLQAGIIPAQARRQLVYAAEDASAQLEGLKLQASYMEKANALYRQYGLGDNLERELALLQTDAERKRQEAELQYQNDLRSYLRSVEVMSPVELEKLAQGLGVQAEPENLREAVKKAMERLLSSRLKGQLAEVDRGLEQGGLSALRQALTSGNLKLAAQALRSPELDKFKDQLRPEELRMLRLRGMESSLEAVDNFRRSLALGEKAALPAEAYQVFSVLPELKDPVKQEFLQAQTDLAEGLSSEFSAARLEAYRKLHERAKQAGLGFVADEAAREVNRLRFGFTVEDYDRSTGFRLPVVRGGTKAVLEDLEEQQRSLEALTQELVGVPLEELNKLTAEGLSRLAKERNVDEGLLKDLRSRADRLAQERLRLTQTYEEELALRPFQKVLLEYQNLGYRLAGASLTEREKVLGGAREQLASALASKAPVVDYETLLTTPDEALKEQLNLSDAELGTLKSFAGALRELDATLREIKVQKYLEEFSSELRKLGFALERLKLSGSFEETRGVLDSLIQSSRAKLNEGLASMRLSEEELYLSEDEALALMRERGVEGDDNLLRGRYSALKDLYGRMHSYKEQRIMLALNEPLNGDDINKVLEKLYDSIKDNLGMSYDEFVNALMTSADDSTLGRLRQSLMQHPAMQRVAAKVVLSVQEGLLVAQQTGDYTKLENEAKGLVPKELQNMDLLSLLGMQRAGILKFAKPEDSVKFTAMAEGALRLRNYELDRMENEISSRYDAYSPLFGDRLSSARLEILKLTELYNSLSSRAKEVQATDPLQAEELQRRAEEVQQELLKAQQRYRYLIVKEWNTLLGDILNSLKSATAEALSTVVKQVLLGERNRQLAEIDRRYSGQLEFEENELSEAKRKLAEAKARMANATTPEELEQAKTLVDYYTRKVEELEEAVRRVRYEWERSKNELKSIAELLGDIFNRLASAFIDKAIQSAVDLLWNAVFSGIRVGVSGAGSSGTSATGQGVATVAVQGTSDAATKAPSADSSGGSLSPQSAEVNYASAIGQGFMGFSYGAASGNPMVGTGLGLAHIGVQTGLQALVGGASLEAAGAAALGAALNPLTIAVVAAGAALGAFVDSSRRAAEHMRTMSLSAAYGTQMIQDKVKRGSRLEVNVNVTTPSEDPFLTSRRIAEATEKELRRKEYEEGLKGG